MCDPLPLSELLTESPDTTQIEPDTMYRELTVKLWGKGVVLRREVPGAEIRAKKRRVAKQGQFIISRIDARHGASGLVPQDLDGAVVSNDFPLYDVDARRVDLRYLRWVSRTNWFVDACRRASEGSTNRVRLKADRFVQTLIPAPDIKIQERIAGTLDRISKNIVRIEEISSRLETRLEALVVALHFNRSKDRVRRIGELLQLTEDRIPVEPTSEYPQIGIKSFGLGLFPKPPTTGLETTYRYFNRVKRDMIVLSQVKGWEGAIAACPPHLDGYFASPEYRTFICIPGTCVSDYIDALIRTAWFRTLLIAATRGQGARRERVRPEKFAAIELPMPDLNTQRTLVPTLKRIASVPPLARDRNSQAALLLDSTLSKLIPSPLL